MGLLGAVDWTRDLYRTPPVAGSVPIVTGFGDLGIVSVIGRSNVITASAQRYKLYYERGRYRTAAYPVIATGFRWATGIAYAYDSAGRLAPRFSLAGYDNRSSLGLGTIQPRHAISRALVDEPTSESRGRHRIATRAIRARTVCGARAHRGGGLAPLGGAHEDRKREVIACKAREGARCTAQRGGNAPDGEAHGDDFAAISRICPARDRNPRDGVGESKGKAREKAEPCIREIEIALDVLEQNVQDLTIGEVEDIDDEQQPEHLLPRRGGGKRLPCRIDSVGIVHSHVVGNSMCGTQLPRSPARSAGLDSAAGDRVAVDGHEKLAPASNRIVPSENSRQ